VNGEKNPQQSQIIQTIIAKIKKILRSQAIKSMFLEPPFAKEKKKKKTKKRKSKKKKKSRNKMLVLRNKENLV